MACNQGQWKYSKCVSSRLCFYAIFLLALSSILHPTPILLIDLMLTQTYGLLGRLLEEGNHIHMVVRYPSFRFAVFGQTFSKFLMPVYPVRDC